MFLRYKSIAIISYGFGLFYATTFSTYLSATAFPPFYLPGMVLAVLYAGLFVSACAAAQLYEKGRQGLVLGNALVYFYSLFLMKNFPDFIQPAYLYLHIIGVLFYVQGKIKRQFVPGEACSGDKKTVLIVDDDEGMRILVKGILAPQGYEILTAGTGEEGLTIAQEKKPDLIVLDVLLPGIKGRDVCTALKNNPQTKNIPVLFLTAKDSPEDIAAERAVGGVAHLQKPVSSRQLLEEITKACR
ncbi:MAG: response regulator [Candidatus Omnitrophica bacterium]|nr:response regulator [Candidatus Omnitrophota bacterium]